MGGVHTSDVEWLTTLRDECEGIAFHSTDHADLHRVRHLFDRLPPDAGAFELLAAKSLAVQTFGRLANRFAGHRQRDVYEWLAELAACDASELRAAWHRASIALVQVAAEAEAHALRDPRVLRASQIIKTRYGDSSLSLNIVARQSGISPWQLSRLMKRSTGQGFMWHVQATRVQAAERLLRDTKLSVKEIAAAVGYTNTTQMDRQFRRARGITPSALRRRDAACNG